MHSFIVLVGAFYSKIRIYVRQHYWRWMVQKNCAQCGGNLHVNMRTVVTKNTRLGHHVNFNGMEISGGGIVTIGNYFHSGKNCRIITQVHNYDYGNAIPYDDVNINKDVNIQDCVWFGEGVTVLGGVTIGEGAIIQACSTVVSDIPAGGIAGGHPAKVFRYRDMKHYEKLKQEGKFY